jgi:hypothetical protein
LSHAAPPSPFESKSASGSNPVAWQSPAARSNAGQPLLYGFPGNALREYFGHLPRKLHFTGLSTAATSRTNHSTQISVTRGQFKPFDAPVVQRQYSESWIQCNGSEWCIARRLHDRSSIAKPARSHSDRNSPELLSKASAMQSQRIANAVVIQNIVGFRLARLYRQQLEI